MLRLRIPATLAVLVAAGCASEEPDDGCDLGEAGYVCPVAGTGALGFNGDGRPALETDLYWASQVRRGPDGRVWLMDFNNHRLRVIEDDGTISTAAGTGWHGFADTGVPAVESPMENPFDFDFLSNGDAVIVSYHDPRVLRLDLGGSLEVLAGSGGIGAGWPATDGDGGPAIDATFVELGGVAIGADDQIYVADLSSGRVRVVVDDRVQPFAGTGERGYAGDGGPATEATLDTPTGVAVGRDGSVYIADRMNHAVRKVAPDGVITTIAGTGVAGFAGDGGPASAAQLDQPDGVAVDAAGVVFIADRQNHRIRRVGLDGTISTIGGVGGDGVMSGDGGLALEASFGNVARLSWSPGELFVADQSNSCARVIHLD